VLPRARSCGQRSAPASLLDQIGSEHRRPQLVTERRQLEAILDRQLAAWLFVPPEHQVDVDDHESWLVAEDEPIDVSHSASELGAVDASVNDIESGTYEATSHCRMVELPTNTISPVGGAAARSPLSKAATYSFQRSAGCCATADEAANIAAKETTVARIDERVTLTLQLACVGGIRQLRLIRRPLLRRTSVA
jgi:hypothetical protein